MYFNLHLSDFNLPSSTRLHVMTTLVTPCCHTNRQKSTTVCGSGPWSDGKCDESIVSRVSILCVLSVCLMWDRGTEWFVLGSKMVPDIKLMHAHHALRVTRKHTHTQGLLIYDTSQFWIKTTNIALHSEYDPLSKLWMGQPISVWRNPFLDSVTHFYTNHDEFTSSVYGYMHRHGNRTSVTCAVRNILCERMYK